MMKTALLALLAAAGLAALPAAAQQAAPAAPSALDTRYSDRNGDMMADAPQDPAQWVDPSTLVFAYTPVEDPAVYRKVWDGFLAHLAKETGKRVQFFAVQNNAAQIEAMRAGRLHVAGFNTGSTPLAVNCSGFVPFAMMSSKTGEFGYEMEIIVPINSAIQKLEDLRGHTLTFSSQTSNSGYKAPVALLQGQFNLREGTDYRSNFSGRHDNSVIGVANRDYEAAAVANSVMRRMIARNTVPATAIRTIYKSDSFPTTAYGIAHNLRPELAEKIRAAFFSYDWQGTPLLEEFSKSEPPQEQFMPISYQNHWGVIRQIDQATNVSYACR
jgi:phosphonate transport system substrate-binding protein